MSENEKKIKLSLQELEEDAELDNDKEFKTNAKPSCPRTLSKRQCTKDKIFDDSE